MLSMIEAETLYVHCDVPRPVTVPLDLSSQAQNFHFLSHELK
jgi:hypothetical protein